MQTASAFISSPAEYHNEAYVHVILDGESQLTLMKKSVSRKLRLKVIGTHRMSIITFRSKEKGPTRETNRVLVELKGQYGGFGVIISAIEVPEICFDALSVAEINSNVTRGLQLADARITNHQPIQGGIFLLVGAIFTGSHSRIYKVIR